MIDSTKHNELLGRTCWLCAHTHAQANSETLRFTVDAWSCVGPDGDLELVRVCTDGCACKRRQRANEIKGQREQGLRSGTRVWQVDRWVEDPASELDPELAPITFRSCDIDD